MSNSCVVVRPWTIDELLVRAGLALVLLAATSIGARPASAEPDFCCCQEYTIGPGGPSGACPGECISPQACSGVHEPVQFADAKCRVQSAVPQPCVFQTVNIGVPAKKCEQTACEVPPGTAKCEWKDADPIVQPIKRCAQGTTPCQPGAGMDCP